MVLTACGAGEDETERWEMEDGTVVYVEPEVRDMFLVDDDAFLLTEVSLELLLLDTDEEVLLDTDEPDTALLGTVDVREPYERVEFRDPK